MKSRYEGKNILKNKKTGRKYMILIVAIVIEKKFNFLRKIYFKILKKIV